MRENMLDFFLGSISPCGFRAYFSAALPPLDGGTVILLKGGPGCGKSTLIKKAAAALAEAGHTVHCIHCSSDPDSLDGVWCPQRKIAIVDATSPHALEPMLPAAFERVLALDRALDAASLQPYRTALAALAHQHQLLVERATRYIAAAGSLLLDSQRTVACCTNAAKAEAFAATLARRYLPVQNTSAQEQVRLLSAFTPQGCIYFEQTVRRTATTVIALDDPYGAAGKMLFEALRKQALARGQQFITCLCPMGQGDKIDHLLFPALGLAFVTANTWHPAHFPGQRTIHASRFMNKEGLQVRRARLRFNRKAVPQLMQQAAALLEEARCTHGQMEEIYAGALNISQLNCMADELLDTL